MCAALPLLTKLSQNDCSGTRNNFQAPSVAEQCPVGIVPDQHLKDGAVLCFENCDVHSLWFTSVLLQSLIAATLESTEMPF